MQANLFEKNIKTLKPFLRSAVIEALHNFQPTKTIVTNPQNLSSINLKTANGYLYPDSALKTAAMQVNQFLSAPFQIKFGDKLMVNPTDIKGWGDAVRANLFSRVSGTSQLSEAKYETAGFLACFGLGLGLQIPLLASRLNVREILIFEPEFEFFYQSLQVIDWQPIIEQITAQNCRIQFFFETNEIFTYFILENAIRGKYFGLVEGSYLIQHYPHPSFPKVYQRLNESMGNLLSYNGWMEDEILHVVNHLQNLNTQKFGLLNAKCSLDTQIKSLAVIIGSGPSLETGIELIKKNRSKLTVFSAGTALKPLLENNITPDFHCELENVEIVSNIITYLSKKFDLSSITLISSTTINPNASRHFDKKLFFKRETNGVLSFLNPDIQQMNNVAPSATNTAVRIADFLGFKSIYLLGVDYGTKNTDQRYAKGVVYDNAQEVNEQFTEKNRPKLTEAGSTSATMKIEVEGNFGSVIHTNPVLTFMRNRLEETSHCIDASIYNISDGAKIKNTIPLSLENFEKDLKQSELYKTHTDFAKEFPPLTKQINNDELVNVEREIENFCSRFRSRLSDITDEQPASIDQLYDIFCEFLHFELEEIAPSLYQSVLAIISGDLLKIFHLVRYMECRLVSGQSLFFTQVINTLQAYLPLIESNALSVLSEARVLAQLPQSSVDHTKDVIWLAKSDRYNMKKTGLILKLISDAPYSALLKEQLLTSILADYMLAYNYDMTPLEAAEKILVEEDISPSTLEIILQFSYFKPNLHQAGMHQKIANFSLLTHIKKPPNSLRITSAQTNFISGNTAQAYNQLELALQNEPEDQIALSWKACFLILSGNIAEGLDILENLSSRITSKTIIAINALGSYRAGKTDKAMEILSQSDEFWMSEPSPDVFALGQYFYAYLLSAEGYPDKAHDSLDYVRSNYQKWEARAEFLFNYKDVPPS